jgi:hypothetical protein
LADTSGMGILGRESAMPKTRETLDLEELVITLYAALDDALAEAGLVRRDGKLEVKRRHLAGAFVGRQPLQPQPFATALSRRSNAICHLGRWTISSEMPAARHWNRKAHPFNWTSKSAAKVMAKCHLPLAA